MRRLLLAFALSSASLQAAPPPRVQIDFAVTSGSMQIGEGRDVLEHDGKRYSVVSESQTVGIAAFFHKLDVRRESEGLLSGKGLQPVRFMEERSRKPRRTADFDWQGGKIKLTDGDAVQMLPLPANTFDQTSFAYAFAFDAPDEDELSVYLTDGRRLSDYRYRKVGVETLKTALGDLKALHYEKVRDAGDKRGFEIWLAVEHHRLPVRIRYIEKNGTVVDSTIIRISYR